ncbi:MAG: phosphatidate cytidylyltransferase [Cytophagales bacterium]
MAERSNLQQRTISGIIGAALMISLIIANEYTFVALATALSLASLHEFFFLIKSKTDFKPNTFSAFLIAFFSLLLTYLIQINFLPFVYYLLILPLVSFAFIHELYRKSSTPFQNIAFTVLGLIYTVLPFVLFIKISFFSQNQYSWHIVLGLFLCLWASDIGAYVAGKTFGKHKLFPSVSPGKTWEGSIGGVIWSMAMAYGLSRFWVEFTLFQWIGMAVIIVVFGMYGDLVESAFKRSIQVKDSGTMIPGHGGFLDRFDGLYLSLPVIYSFLVIFS